MAAASASAVLNGALAVCGGCYRSYWRGSTASAAFDILALDGDDLRAAAVDAQYEPRAALGAPAGRHLRGAVRAGRDRATLSSLMATWPLRSMPQMVMVPASLSATVNGET